MCLLLVVHGAAPAGPLPVPMNGATYMAFRDVGGSDWSVVGTAPIPEAALDLNGTGDYQLAWLDDQIVIGTSDTPTELAGTRIGHVQFMTLEEAIFRSGFD